MKVVITGCDLLDSLERNVFVTLQGMGHTAIYADDLPLLRYENPLHRFVVQTLFRHPRFELFRSHRIARQVIEQKPDLFICVWSWLRPEAAQRIRDAGIKTVFLYPDHIANLDRQYVLLAPYHLLFFKDPYAVRLFRDKAGLPIYYLPEACNPMWHKPVQLTAAERQRYQCDLTTASTMYPYRLRLLEVFEGYDIKLWGPPWPVWLQSPLHKYWTGIGVSELEKAKAFGAAKIVLNTMHYAEIDGVNCRTFEAAGCGAFQIADSKPALSELFEPDKEIVTFASREELKDKVDYYLRHPEERERIARAGYLRAHRDHTWEIRIRRIFDLLSKHV